MAGYSGTPLPKKLGLKEGMTFAVVNAPDGYEAMLGGLPAGAKRVARLGGKLPFIHFFTSSRAELAKRFAALKKTLADDGALWISWPKRSSKVATDLDESIVRELGLAAGLVDVKVCAVDETWSGLKFVYRIKDRAPRSP
jgi:hypothetical protein